MRFFPMHQSLRCRTSPTRRNKKRLQTAVFGVHQVARALPKVAVFVHVDDGVLPVHLHPIPVGLTT